jgi:hypothetical protein
MKVLGAVALAVLGLAPLVGAGDGSTEASDRLVAHHKSASGTLTLRTPAGWTAETTSGQPERIEARGQGLIVRVLRVDGEVGLDSLHVQCMMERLTPPMEARPEVDYEYDFHEGHVGERRALDSAFVVHYDEPIEGERDWRQRNITLVGLGDSICVIGMTPRSLWKKSKETRELLDAVMEGIELD